MASHGVPRVSGEKPQSDQARKKELQDIEDYKYLVDTINTKMKERKYTIEVLHMTSKLLKWNPEYYTIWNHRRLIVRYQFIHGNHVDQESPSQDLDDRLPEKDQEAITQIISNDLEFLFPLLRKFPKCYWIWNYRLWLLQESSRLLPMMGSQRLWQQELGLASKMLSRDSRNFHGWGYRRTVVAALEINNTLDLNETSKSMTEEEFGYTTRMIQSNLSNFSAWHNRSKLISRLLNERKADDAARRGFLDKELEFIQRALWADSNDQSLGFYHQYLIGTFDPKYAQQSMAPRLTTNEHLAYVNKEFENILDMLDGAEDCKWIYKALVQLAIMHKELSGRWPRDGDEVRGWVSELHDLDPLRSGRWDDLMKDLCVC